MLLGARAQEESSADDHGWQTPDEKRPASLEMSMVEQADLDPPDDHRASADEEEPTPRLVEEALPSIVAFTVSGLQSCPNRHGIDRAEELTEHHPDEERRAEDQSELNERRTEERNLSESQRKQAVAEKRVEKTSDGTASVAGE